MNKCIFEDDCLLGCCAVVVWQKLTDVSEVPTAFIITHHSDEGGSTYLRNVGQFLPDYTAQHPTRQIIFRGNLKLSSLSFHLCNGKWKNRYSSDSRITFKIYLPRKWSTVCNSMERNSSWEAVSLSASQNFCPLLWKVMFVTVFTRFRHWSGPWAIWIYFTSSKLISLLFILKLYFHFCLHPLSCFFPSDLNFWRWRNIYFCVLGYKALKMEIVSSAETWCPPTILHCITTQHRYGNERVTSFFPLAAWFKRTKPDSVKPEVRRDLAVSAGTITCVAVVIRSADPVGLAACASVVTELGWHDSS
jgi:hypothetical protein